MTHGDYRMMASRSEFHEAVRNGFALAAQSGCRELLLSDTDFSDWPLGEPAVVESLRLWALPHRKLTLLAHGFDEVARRHPRWVEWRRHFSHVVDCRINTELEDGQIPVLFVAPGLFAMRLHDPIHYRGSVSHDAASLVRCREAFDAALQRSASGFPPTILGI